MSDFVLQGVDYEPYLTSTEQFELFERMQEILPQLKGVHISLCWQKVEEFENLRRKLVGINTPFKIVPINQNVSKNPQLN